MINTNTPIHTQTNIEPERNGMIFARKFPAAAGRLPKMCGKYYKIHKKIQGANETPLYCY